MGFTAGERVRGSDAANVGRLKALGPLDGFELHLVAFAQGPKTLGGDGGVVDEQVRPTLLRDETKTLRVIEPLHSTRLHRFPLHGPRSAAALCFMLEGLCDGGNRRT